jgi:hypothetical protein
MLFKEQLKRLIKKEADRMAKRIGIGILAILVILVVYFIVRQAPIDRQPPSLPFSQSPSVQTTSCILAQAFALWSGAGPR